MLNLLTLFRSQTPSGTRTIYVATTGSDSNNGLTTGASFLTVQAAVNQSLPGDRIIVAPGIYAPFSVYNRGGTAQYWLTVEGVGARIDCVDNATDGAAGIDTQLATYVGIFGFEVYGAQTMTPVSISGVAVFRSSHHILVWGNTVHDFPSGGINCFYVQAANGLPGGGWDIVDVSFNTVYNCCKYDPDNASGISMFGATDLTGTTWDGRYGYRVVGNYIYNCECLVPYTAGGFTFVTDGNGISLDSLNTATVFNSGNNPYIKFGLNEGNVVAGCGGRGLHIYDTINVDDFFNTYIGNLTNVTGSQGITGGVETDASYDTAPTGGNGVTHYGNLICPLNTPNTTDTVSTYTANVILGGTQTVPSGNTDRRTTGASYFTGAPTAAQVLTGLPLSAFQPVTPDTVTRAAHWRGYQTLGAGPRGPVHWSAGALEPSARPRIFVHS